MSTHARAGGNILLLCYSIVCCCRLFMLYGALKLMTHTTADIGTRDPIREDVLTTVAVIRDCVTLDNEKQAERSAKQSTRSA